MARSELICSLSLSRLSFAILAWSIDASACFRARRMNRQLNATNTMTDKAVASDPIAVQPVALKCQNVSGACMAQFYFSWLFAAPLEKLIRSGHTVRLVISGYGPHSRFQAIFYSVTSATKFPIAFGRELCRT